MSTSIRRQRATLEGFARMFLCEVERANRSFAARRVELVRALTEPRQRAALLGSLGGRERDAEAIAETLISQAAQAAGLAIVEVTVTFWVEPARPGCWEAIFRFFRRLCCKPRADEFAGLYCLAPAERREHAAKYEMRIGPARDAELAATEPRLVQAPNGAALDAFGAASARLLEGARP